MDAFQGSYRTEPRDMRYFSAFYLLLRVIMLAQVQLFVSSQVLNAIGVLSFTSTIIVLQCEPYQVRIHNKRDSILMLLMGIITTSTYIAYLSPQYNRVAEFSRLSSTVVLLVLFLHFVMYSKLRMLIKKIKDVCNSTPNINHGDRETIDYTDRDFDRYPPLLNN